MPRLGRSAVAGLLFSTGALAQVPDAIVIRAVGPHVSSEVVQHVARYARPFDLRSRSPGVSKPLTAREIVVRLCGSFRQDYWVELLAMNKVSKEKSLDSEQVVTDPGAWSWPRCFYVEVYTPPRVIEVGLKDTPLTIYRRFTGSPGSEEGLKSFFKASTSELEGVKPGHKVSVPHRTLPVTVVPRDGRVAEFRKELERIEVASRKPGTVGMLISDPALGWIVNAVPTFGESNCVVFEKQPPFEVNAVKVAYEAAYDAVKEKGDPPRRARIMIVDNGFFGANPANDKDPFEGSPFPSRYFRPSADSGSLLAERINVNTIDYIGDQGISRPFIDPLNYFHDIPADDVSGHGTHVTGLALGGPAFVAVRDKLRDKAAPWAEITILNVGKGSNTLVSGAHEQVFRAATLSDAAYIVNLSVGYTADARGVRDIFDDLKDKIGKRGLLVAAAGNGGGRLSTSGTLPGVLGGMSADNVLTVAAHDAASVIAPFSNHDQTLVDIAAPGCGVDSWIATWTAPLSGTSMATPLVTFAAGLLRSVFDKWSGADIKHRLIAAADLLPATERNKTAYGGVKLNVAKPLYWFHDYVRIGKEELLGDVERLTENSWQCKDEEEGRAAAEILSIKKRDDGSAWMFLGKRNRKVQQVCELRDAGSGTIVFKPTHEITPERIVPLPPEKRGERRIALKDLGELVYRGPPPPK